MAMEDGLVKPVVTGHQPRLGPLAIMAATGGDVQIMRRYYPYPDTRSLYLSKLYFDANESSLPVLVGPIMGAPYAVMVLETLRAWGVQSILFFGWCGSISADLRIGDILLPDSAVVDEGTSLHYQQGSGNIVRPCGDLHSRLEKTMGRGRLSFLKGRVWSTDGIFRETPSQIKKFQDQGALAVEMEFSALCSVARFYELSLAALLVVSDELFTLKWRQGFKEHRFQKSRTAVCHMLTQMHRS